MNVSREMLGALGSPAGEKRAKGMTRSAKIFFKIDKEGLLMETVSVTASVNFDCYESIVTSAQRVLASHHGLRPTDIRVQSIFYYKKRARSNRMNPAQILTTTDVFRAVAEHPTGEIPIGVSWTESKTKNNDEYQLGRNRLQQAKLDKEAADSIRVTVKEEVEDEEEPAPKRTRIEYKTYMPGTTENNSRLVHAGESSSQFVISEVFGSNNTQIDSNQASRKSTVSNSAEINGAMPASHLNDAKQRNLKIKKCYQWPTSVTCEVILHYDGVSERKVLSPGLSNVVEQIVKGNYSQLSNEAVNTLRMGTTDLLEVFKEVNSCIDKPMDPLSPVTGVKNPIKYLNTAKTEIFKVLSLVNLSRSKFKQLLDWMKTLKLEEGKQGKFYLSERNLISGGLRATYDTDVEAAAKLHQLYKKRIQPENAKVLHPLLPYNKSNLQAASSMQNVAVDPTQHVTVSMSADGNPANQYMFILPKTSIESAQPTFIPVSASQMAKIAPTLIPTSGSPALTVHGSSSFVPTSTYSSTSDATVANPLPHISRLAKTSSDQASPGVIDNLKNLLSDSGNKTRFSKRLTPSEESKESSPSPAEPNTSKNVPSILRRKQKNPLQKRKSTSPPVPLQLYRSYAVHGGDDENMATFGDSLPSGITVKTERDDYNSDATEDFADTATSSFSSPNNDDTFGESSRKNYGTVLKSDARMPQNSDQLEGDKPFEIIIKSEPLDAYD